MAEQTKEVKTLSQEQLDKLRFIPTDLIDDLAKSIYERNKQDFDMYFALLNAKQSKPVVTTDDTTSKTEETAEETVSTTVDAESAE